MKYIIDTDVGIDDVEAIVYLLSCPDVEVVAITLVAGNSCIKMISENIRRFLSFIDAKHIPVYEGGSYNLQGKYIESDGYFGSNAFANIELPETDLQTQKDMNSVEALIHYNKKFPGEIQNIFIGPLTNLALAFLTNNDFPSYCGQITIMGGDRNLTTIKNASPHAEFNSWCDPVAVDIVSRHFSKRVKFPIFLIDWHCCWNHLLSMAMFANLFGADRQTVKTNRHVEIMSILRDFSNEIIRKGIWEKGFVTADLFAVMVAHDHSIVTKSRRVSIDKVDTIGEMAGHTTYKEDKDGLFILVDEINLPELEKRFVTRLTSFRK